MPLINIITDLFTKIKDGDGEGITSTDLGAGKRALDINVHGGSVLQLGNLHGDGIVDVANGNGSVLTPDVTISIQNAKADGLTKGAAAFNTFDFSDLAGIISLDYINAQSASATNNGFLSAEDWLLFYNKADVASRGDLTASLPISISNGLDAVFGTGVSITIADATTIAKGAVQLSNSYTGISTNLATTEKALSDGLNTKEPTIYPKNSAFNQAFETLLSNIKMDSNTASLGSSNNVPRSDHIHPSDTTREPAISIGMLSQYYRGDKSWQTLDKNAVGLLNVTNDAQLKRAAGDFNSFTNMLLSFGDTFLFEDASNAFIKNKVSIDDIAAYGYYIATSNTLNTTTSTTFQNKLTLTTPVIPAGTYAILVNHSWYYTKNNRAFNSQVLVDGSTIAWSTVMVPADQSSVNRYPASGFGIIEFAAAGVHSIALNYKSSNILDTAGIENARLLLYKIS